MWIISEKIKCFLGNSKTEQILKAIWLLCDCLKLYD